MRIDRKPDEVISHKPAVCEGCPYAVTCKLRSCETRYEYDVEVKTKLIAHEAMGCDCCHMTGQAERGAFPAHIILARLNNYAKRIVKLSEERPSDRKALFCSHLSMYIVGGS